MSFLNPALLWGFALVALPLLIHLVNRWRHKTVRWAAMEMLLRAAHKSRGVQRLRNWLILLARMLAIAALAAVVVRPLVGGGWMGAFGSGKLDAVVVILDRSVSMERRDPILNKPLREVALENLVKELELNRKGSRIILLDSATQEPLVLSGIEQLKEVPQAQASDGEANIPLLMNRAVDFLEQEGFTASEIWIVSDQQETNWRPRDSAWQTAKVKMEQLPEKPSVRIMGMSAADINDSTLRLDAALRQGENLELDYGLQSFGEGAPQELIVSVDGNEFEEPLPLFEGELRDQLRLPLDEDQKSGWISLSLPADGNESNSQVFAVYGESMKLNSALVAKPTTQSAAALELAMAPPLEDAEELFEFSENPLWDEINWEELALLVVRGVPPASAEKEVLEYLESGGQMLLMPEDESVLAAAEDGPKKSFQGLSWGEVQNAPGDSYFDVGPVVVAQGVLQNFRGGESFDFTPTFVIRRQVPVAEKAQSLITYDDGSAFLSRLFVGERGVVYALSTLPDYTWSSLSDQVAFLPLLQRLQRIGAQRLSEQRAGVVGMELPPVPAPARWEYLDQGQWVPVLEQRPMKAGIYRAGPRLLALNAPQGELQLAPVEQEQLEELFEGVEWTLLLQEAGSEEGVTREAWRIAAVLLILFLIAEAILSLPGKPVKSSFGTGRGAGVGA